jgi:hypothetical protein
VCQCAMQESSFSQSQLAESCFSIVFIPKRRTHFVTALFCFFKRASILLVRMAFNSVRFGRVVSAAYEACFSILCFIQRCRFSFENLASTALNVAQCQSVIHEFGCAPPVSQIIQQLLSGIEGIGLGGDESGPFSTTLKSKEPLRSGGFSVMATSHIRS